MLPGDNRHERAIHGLPAWRFGIIDEALLDALQYALDGRLVGTLASSSQLHLRHRAKTRLHLAANMNPQGFAGLSIESKHEDLLAAFPQVHDLPDRREDLRMHRPAG